MPLGQPSNIYIMWCYGAQKGKTTEWQTEKERSAYKLHKEACRDSKKTGDKAAPKLDKERPDGKRDV